MQLLFILGYPALIVIVAVRGYEWVSAAPNLVQVYLRAVAFGAAMFLGLCTLPILLKWVLIGRWKPQEIRVWSMAYLRFWLVKTLVQREPDGALRRFTALRALPEGPGREGRARRRHPGQSGPCAPTCSASATAR